MTAALWVRGLSAGYAGSTVLRGLDLDVPAGTVLALLGRNGAGKTTLLHALFGLLRPTAGTVHVHGADATGLATHRLARSGMALVPQGRRVFAPLTVAEHLTLAGRRRRDGRPGPDRADVLALFPRLGDRLAQRADRLSGGEQQMLALARALLLRPRLLLLDEPFEGLAAAVTARVAALLPELARASATVLLVEQRVELATAVADRVTFLADGKLTPPTGEAPP
ncbi:ABC transporter ATP-binding protein [Longispora fulva]|uniref:Branched-chain amino acid transport system ATP-binding protein n=1 Tax=Longispora fulva TaxID=619741 RepID=A0A8J7GB54_9ACTN|nr:ATP-binding cassette domain-containing protein [Longispora fulva]MBG6134156.1 branched-chain amino acid transport system ATP-binding protein [Longispora fulva]GIG62529.1 ABC transporter ATP-binding protein [Longispora fulva]